MTTPASHVTMESLTAAQISLKASGYDRLSFTTLNARRHRWGDVYEEYTVPAILALKTNEHGLTTFPVTFMIFGDLAGGSSEQRDVELCECVEFQLIQVEKDHLGPVDITKQTLMCLYWDVIKDDHVVPESVHSSELRGHGFR